MDFYEALQTRTKQQIALIVATVGDNQKLFDELFAVLLSNNSVMMQRAAWTISYCVQNHPQLIRKHLDNVVALLKQSKLHNGIKRNLLRFLKDISIEEKYAGELTDIAFQLMHDIKQPAAIKVFAMRTLANICRTYPELKQELLLSIQDMQHSEVPSIISASRDVIKQLEKTKSPAK